MFRWPEETGFESLCLPGNQYVPNQVPSKLPVIGGIICLMTESSAVLQEMHSANRRPAEATAIMKNEYQKCWKCLYEASTVTMNKTCDARIWWSPVGPLWDTCFNNLVLEDCDWVNLMTKMNYRTLLLQESSMPPDLLGSCSLPMI